MNLKRFMLVLMSIAMLTAVMASSASAAVETGGTWHVEGIPNFVGPESVACSIGKHAGEEKIALEGEITGLGPVVLTATGIECINAKIFNNAGGHAFDEGELKFTGVTIDGALGTVCSVQNNAVTTNNLETELFMDSEEPEIAFDKFEPAGGGANIAVVQIVGGSCPVAGKKPVRGYVYGEAVNRTGVHSETQPLTFSEAVDTTAGSELKFAGNEAHLTGNVVNFLSGANAFAEFWAE